MAKKQKIYIGKITKGKRKGKTGFVKFKDYVKQNIDDISPESLNKKEFETYRKIIFARKQAQDRIRIDGKFISKQAEGRIKLYLKRNNNAPLTKENIKDAAKVRLQLTLRGNEINDIIQNHRGLILLNGIAMTKPEAQTEYDKLNRMNIREWADIINRNEDAIYFIIYDSWYLIETKELNISTVVTDVTRVIISPIKNLKK
jgi:hypothetical protein